MISFWDKAAECKHEHLHEHYRAGGRCPTPLCDGWSEYHCKDCGAYVAECPCGSCSGKSGWPFKRILKRERKRQSA
jgi:hypothetical protein